MVPHSGVGLVGPPPPPSLQLVFSRPRPATSSFNRLVRSVDSEFRQDWRNDEGPLAARLMVSQQDEDEDEEEEEEEDQHVAHD